MTTPLYYADTDQEYDVQMFDVVEVTNPLTGIVYDGVVKTIKPRVGRVVCLIEDHHDITRSCNPRKKRMEVPVANIVLIARDG